MKSAAVHTAAALFYEILRLDLVEIVKALVALAEAGKELLQIVPEVDHGDCNAADNDDTADDAQNELQIVLHEIDLPY
jgi:Ni,Fe-hydrogenase I large subunit